MNGSNVRQTMGDDISSACGQLVIDSCVADIEDLGNSKVHNTAKVSRRKKNVSVVTKQEDHSTILRFGFAILAGVIGLRMLWKLIK